jgi:hypothetical protein
VLSPDEPGPDQRGDGKPEDEAEEEADDHRRAPEWMRLSMSRASVRSGKRMVKGRRRPVRIR